MIRIGLIADTHGLLRPQACDYLRGCDFIVHAGDICDAQILDQLALIAPVTAVRGNIVTGPWADRLPDTEFLQCDFILGRETGWVIEHGEIR